MNATNNTVQNEIEKSIKDFSEFMELAKQAKKQYLELSKQVKNDKPENIDNTAIVIPVKKTRKARTVKSDIKPIVTIAENPIVNNTEKTVLKTINKKQIKISIQENTAIELKYRLKQINQQIEYLITKLKNDNFNLTDKHIELFTQKVCESLGKLEDEQKKASKPTVKKTENPLKDISEFMV